MHCQSDDFLVSTVCVQRSYARNAYNAFFLVECLDETRAMNPRTCPTIARVVARYNTLCSIDTSELDGDYIHVD